jgi:hypothetical protein
MNKSLIEQLNEMKPFTVLLILIVIFLVWNLVCKSRSEPYCNNYDYDVNYMDAGAGPDLYNAVNTMPSGSMTYGYRGDLTAALPGESQRSDWMTNRFTTSTKDNFISSGMAGDSICSPGYVMAGQVYGKSDPRDIVGQANSSLTSVPYQSTQELQQLLPYGSD